MGQTVRFGVSLDSDLLARFDALCERRGYSARSEAIRDLIREVLVEREAEDEDADIAGTVTLVYDHHRSDLTERLNAMQHDALDLVISTLHVHLNHDNCLEALVVRGQGARVRSFVERLISMKGVKHGRFSLTTTARCLNE